MQQLATVRAKLDHVKNICWWRVGLLGSVLLGGACSDPEDAPADDAGGFDVAAHLLATGVGAQSEAPPHGVPEHWDWVTGAVGTQTAPPGDAYTHANYWGAVFRGAANTTPTNTLVELRRCSFWLLYQGETSWLQVPTSAALGGSTFSPTYDAGGPDPDVLESDQTGARVVPAPDHIWHFWPENGYQPIRDRDQIVEVLTNCQTRLALRDSAGPDDRASADYLVHVGADWRDPADPGCANDAYICPSLGVGRFERVRSDWRNTSFHSVSSADLEAGIPLPPASAFGLPPGAED